MNLSGESWRLVPGFPGYEVSSVGRIRSLKSGRILRTVSNRGYVQVRLRMGGIAKCVRSHSLVMMAFVGPREASMQVNHKNGNKADNRVENLEYVTSSGNNLHAHRTGLHPGVAGEKNPRAKLTTAEVCVIRGRRSSGEKLRTIAEDFGISIATVHNIFSGARWAKG